MLYKAVLAFESVDEILRKHSIEKYFGTEYYTKLLEARLYPQ